jgi:hypothetical protein
MTNPILVAVHGMQFHEGKKGVILIYNSVSAIRFRNDFFLKKRISYNIYFILMLQACLKISLIWPIQCVTFPVQQRFFASFFVTRICVGTYKTGM